MWFLYNKCIIFDKFLKIERLQNTQRLWDHRLGLRRKRAVSNLPRKRQAVQKGFPGYWKFH